jgi:hypothetical protein
MNKKTGKSDKTGKATENTRNELLFAASQPLQQVTYIENNGSMHTELPLTDKLKPPAPSTPLV